MMWRQAQMREEPERPSLALIENRPERRPDFAVFALAPFLGWGLSPFLAGRTRARVLPEAPYRHWALSYPYPVRLALARNWPAAALSCKIFLSEVFRFQRREARRRGARAPKTGAISFTQAKGTTAIIHLALRLSDMRVDQVKVSTVKTGESFRNCETHKGILDIADRGYSNQA